MCPIEIYDVIIADPQYWPKGTGNFKYTAFLDPEIWLAIGSMPKIAFNQTTWITSRDKQLHKCVIVLKLNENSRTTLTHLTAMFFIYTPWKRKIGVKKVKQSYTVPVNLRKKTLLDVLSPLKVLATNPCSQPLEESL